MDFEQIAVSNEKKLKQNKYPGRGIVIGMSPDGKKYIQVYWIMGRSENSRNRIFKADGEFIKTQAYDEAKMVDPSLIIYYPVKAFENYHIVTNGDQTDTIYDCIKNGKTFEDALVTREFEPDPPNFTPRISGITDLSKEKASYALSILRSINNNSEFCQRNYYYYSSFIAGFGHCIHTYNEDGNPIPSFDKEPYIVKLHNNIDDNADYFWNLLNEDNKVSLLVKYIDKADKTVETKIINKHNS